MSFRHEILISPEHGAGISIIEMGARQYSPVLGRFLEVDPVEGGCSNDYMYVSDPVNSSDLDGRICPRKGGFFAAVTAFLSARPLLQGAGHYLDGNSFADSAKVAAGGTPSLAAGQANARAKTFLEPWGAHSRVSSIRWGGIGLTRTLSRVFGWPATIGVTLLDFFCNPATFKPRANKPLPPGPTPPASVEYLRNQNA